MTHVYQGGSYTPTSTTPPRKTLTEVTKLTATLEMDMAWQKRQTTLNTIETLQNELDFLIAESDAGPRRNALCNLYGRCERVKALMFPNTYQPLEHLDAPWVTEAEKMRRRRLRAGASSRKSPPKTEHVAPAGAQVAITGPTPNSTVTVIDGAGAPADTIIGAVASPTATVNPTPEPDKVTAPASSTPAVTPAVSDPKRDFGHFGHFAD